MSHNLEATRTYAYSPCAIKIMTGVLSLISFLIEQTFNEHLI